MKKSILALVLALFVSSTASAASGPSIELVVRDMISGYDQPTRFRVPNPPGQYTGGGFYSDAGSYFGTLALPSGKRIPLVVNYNLDGALAKVIDPRLNAASRDEVATALGCASADCPLLYATDSAEY